MEQSVNRYPPREFFDKYQKYLAPNGILVAPEDLLLRHKSPNVLQSTIKKAFKITVTRLERMRDTCCHCFEEIGTGKKFNCKNCEIVVYCSKECMDQRKESHATVCNFLKEEKLDQVLECFPFPVQMGKDILKKKTGIPQNWKEWFNKSTHLSDRILSSLKKLQAWWPYTSLIYPGDDAIKEGLMRMVTDTFSTVLTIAYGVNLLMKVKKPQSSSLVLHLIGAADPEVQAIESGLIELVSRLIGKPLELVLVAPDLVKHLSSVYWTPQTPFRVTDKITVTSYAELYHTFWEKNMKNGGGNVKMRRPDAAIIIHPGIHTDSMFYLWKPTINILKNHSIPILMTTYNRAEYDATVEILEPLEMNYQMKGINPFGSQKLKQTPYEADHLWAINSFMLAIQN